MVLAEDGTPLRAFADEQGVWRFPTTLDQVSPHYLDALITYEDRWFYYHFGVNPLAMLRAFGQWLFYGEIVSGGSTLTMQVARILVPHKRSLVGKLQQVFRALQLEWHYSKDEILTIYLNLAPFGGAIEGVQTASYAYLHKPAADLSHAEAALLAVLPQAPSRLRPDRHPKRAQYYRDKVLKRLATFQVWSQQTVTEALQEEVVKSQFRQPFVAPLLARRLLPIARKQQLATIHSSIDLDIQWSVESLIKSRLQRLHEKASAAVLVMENKTGFVRAYVGSAEFHNSQRSGHVDMVQAIRSPGSTLKPFLYAFAIDEGLIHSASLLSDVPLQRQSYRPANFMRDYRGPVSATQALQLSLNVPAVTLLQHLGVGVFSSKLLQAGIPLTLPKGSEPNLSMILGGVGTKLETLVHGFSSFSRQGISIKPRLVSNDPIMERRAMSAGAAWMTQTMLKGISPPAGSSKRLGVAWKTGTSYGFRDAWSIGTNQTYTVGVWIGRPDGTPLSGEYGAKAAGPILFDVFNTLPRSHAAKGTQRPNSVSRTTICWPLGQRKVDTQPEYCQQKHSAWLLNETAPLTLPDVQQPSWSAAIKTYWVNSETNQQANRQCTVLTLTQRNYVQWPLALQPWLSKSTLQLSQLPSWDNACPETVRLGNIRGLRIQHLESGVRFVLPHGKVNWQLRASGGQGKLTWLMNKKVIGVTENNNPLPYQVEEAGEYEVMVLDEVGQVDKVLLTVLDR